MRPPLLTCLLVSLTICVHAQSPSLKIDRNSPVRISVVGDGAHYDLEGTADLNGGWQLLSTLPGINAQAGWLDSQSTLLPRRFYRALKVDGYEPPFAVNFALIDHQDRWRDLAYYFNATNTKAFVFVFTGNGCADVHRFVSTLNSLRSYFTSRGVLFWMIDANQQDNRSNIVAEAAARGIQLPILHDPAQVVARSYAATKTPEVVCVGSLDWTVFYRGAIDDRTGSGTVATTQHYLSNALTSFLAGQPVSPIRTRPEGCDITFRPRYDITYSRDIAPLLENKCFYCHSPGNIAPFAMTNYASVVAVWPLIREEVMHAHMPPWFADPHHGRFSNDRSLTPEEKAKLIQWIDDGVPRGEGPDLLETASIPVGYPFAWPEALGTPDQILSIPLQNVPANGVVEYLYIDVPTTFPTDVWLRAAVVKPGNTKVVHHVLVFDGGSGTGLEGFFSGYVPGFDATPFPPNTGKFLPRGKVLEFQMHYITIGTNQTDQTQIGLYVMPAPPTYPLQTKSAFDLLFNIPANTAGYQREAFHPTSGTLNTNILLYEMSPHMHLRGSSFKYEVIYPNSSTEVLLSVPHYIFHWQTLYRLATPKYLPRGSRIKCTAVWDNTLQNHQLMEQHHQTLDPLFLPSRNVRFGEQSYDEMFIGYMNYAEVP